MAFNFPTQEDELIPRNFFVEEEESLPLEISDSEALVELDRTPSIDPMEQVKLIEKLKSYYGSFKEKISDHHENINEWHRLYEGLGRNREKRNPWPGASDFQVPLIMTIVESFHARLIKSIFDVDPVWIAKPRTKFAVMLAKKAEKYLDYWADQMDLRSVLDQVINLTLIEGVGVIKLDWVRREVESLATGVGLVEYDGPQAYPVPIKDFILIPYNAPSIETASYVGHKTLRTDLELLERAGSVYFNVEKLLESRGSAPASDMVPITGDSSSFATDDTGDEYGEANYYEIIDLYGLYDFGDGKPVPSLITFSNEAGVLLRCEPYPYAIARSPYISFSVLPRANFFWGRSYSEILMSSQEELTTLHNQRTDAIQMRVSPTVIKRSGTMWDPDETPIGPGQVIEVNDLSEVTPLELPDLPTSIFAHGQEILNFVEKLTGLNDYSLGATPSQNRSATEVNKVTSEGLVRLDVLISRLAPGMKKLGWAMWLLLLQNRPQGDTFMIGDEESTITPQEMIPEPGTMMPFEFLPQGQVSDVSKEVRRQQHLLLYSAVEKALYDFNPDGLRIIMNEVFRAFDVENRDEILGLEWNQKIEDIIEQAKEQGLEEGMERGKQQGMAEAKQLTAGRG